MTHKNIAEIFQDRKGEIIGNFKKSAVMILITEEENNPQIIFEVRAETLRHQPGDICLPGGKIDDGETPLTAAIRETKEELNLKDDDFQVLGAMDYFVSPYGSIMYPFVAVLKNNRILPNSSEVDHIFNVPLKYFLNTDPLKYEMKIGPTSLEGFPFHLIKGGKDYKFSSGKMAQYFFEYEGYVIWGFTARIIKAFIDILKEKENL